MIKPIDDELYGVVCGWWKGHGWPVLPRELLPKRGRVAFLGEKPVIAGFLYKDETASFGMVEWIISNHESTREERDVCFNDLMLNLFDEAKKIGIKILTTTSNHSSLISRLESVGFTIDNTNITHMFKEI